MNTNVVGRLVLGQLSSDYTCVTGMQQQTENEPGERGNKTAY